MQNTINTISYRINGHGRGWVFFPRAFADIADPRVIGVMLGRLVKQGKIRRLSRGIYDYPKAHSDLGRLYPSINKIAEAISKRDKIRLLPSGAYAANLLGLSDQVPAKVVFLTEGKPRKINVDGQTIELKKASPKLMTLAQKDSGVVIQALRYLGQNYIDDKVIGHLRRTLSDKTKQELLNNLDIAPGWMRKVLEKIARD